MKAEWWGDGNVWEANSKGKDMGIVNIGCYSYDLFEFEYLKFLLVSVFRVFISTGKKSESSTIYILM